jgi:hypothetical protein
MLAAMALVSLALPAAAENWPRFRGPTGQGISTETGLPTRWSATENVAWKTPIPGQGWSSPIVWGDRVFATTGFTSTTPNGGPPAIRAIRPGGKGDCTRTHIAWEQTKGVSMTPSMLYAKPYLFAPQENGTVRCLKAASGEVVGELRLRGQHTASPIWAEGRVYFLSEKGETTIAEAGPEFKEVARNMLGEKCCASPAVSQGQIFIRSEGNLYCIGK